jgi:hypothetical protein
MAGSFWDQLDGLGAAVPNSFGPPSVRAQGCRWLLLDRDADCVDSLKTFEW